MNVPILVRCLTHLDIVTCNHGGVVNLLLGVMTRKRAFAEGAHLVTEKELLHAPIVHCATKPPLTPCTKVVRVVLGRAMHAIAGEEIILLENLIGITNGAPPGIAMLAANVFAMIGLHEGAKRHVYDDTAKPPKKTVGMGLNLERDPDALKKAFKAEGLDYDKVIKGEQDLSDAQIQKFAAADIASHTRSAQNSVTNWAELSGERQRALIDLAFNAGTPYKSVTALISKGDFKGAADRLLEVKWTNKKGEEVYYKDIQPTRAARVAAAIRGSYVYAMPE